MTPDERPKFISALTLLTEVLGGAGLSAPAVEVYWRALADVAWPAVEAACQRTSLSCRFFPKPVELRELAVGKAESDEDRVERAWQAWRVAAQKVGAYRSLYVEDGACAAALVASFGGWPEACLADLTPEMWSAKRKEFGRVYRISSGATPQRLPGQHERDNALRGHGLTALTAPLMALLPDGRIEDQVALPAGEDEPKALPESRPLSADEARELWQQVVTRIVS